MRRPSGDAMDETYLRLRHHDICSWISSVPFLRPRCPRRLLGRAYSSAALAPTVLESELGDFHRGAPLSKPAVDIATAQPITDADAPVIVFMSVQVLQVSRLSTRNFLSDPTEYWRSTVILSAPFLLVARWRYFVLRTEVKSGLSSVLVIVAVGWVVPRDGPVAGKTRSYGVLVLPEACLETCLEAWSLCFFACGVRWGRKLSDEEVQEKASTDTELFIQEVTPTEVIQDQEGSEKASDEVSTAGAKKGIASEEVPIVSTAEVNLSTAGGTVTYSRRSAEKRSRQDKGKAIMIEEEPKKKSKKELEQERLSYVEAIRLEEQMNEEQRAQIARDEEIARQWDEEERKRAMDEAKSVKKIDWNNPSVIRYHTQKLKPKIVAQARRDMIKYLKNQGNYKISDFKGMSYNDIRPIFEKVWDFNQNIEPMDAEHGNEKQKSPAKEKSPEKIVEEEVDTQEVVKEVVKEPGAKRKKSIPRKSTRKRQKLEEDAEKEELKGLLDIIPREEVPIEVESISTKFPIVDWKTYVLTETFMYYQVFRGDGSSKNYKILSEMLEDFDRQDVEELYRLVKERYSTSRPEGFDLMLWGDLHTLFEPDEDDEIWKDQHEYNLLSWRLCDFCGIHILLMENGLAIHMLTEKKYPLSQEMLTKMLSRKLEVDHESSQAFELLRFIRSQLDLELVPKENRLDIGKCNGRIPHGLKPKEETFQVVLDALALAPCYTTFLITADVPEIFLRVPGRDFDALPSEEDTISFLRDLGHTGVINSLNFVIIDQMHQPWRTFAALINRSLSGKTSGLDKLCLSQAQILWGMYH
ncbi:hypothetical protein Tco_0046066 [Tanacetum coccineum]